MRASSIRTLPLRDERQPSPDNREGFAMFPQLAQPGLKQGANSP
jgi:hypothetical protein